MTDDVLNCSILLLHKGGHHIINPRLTNITEAENLIVPGQDGGRAGRGVDLNQLKLDWITSEAQRLKQRILRIDIDFKNAFNSMSQSALWAVMRAYNLPDIDLLEAVYSRTTVCMDPEDARCATITFLTGVIQGGASSRARPPARSAIFFYFFTQARRAAMHPGSSSPRAPFLRRLSPIFVY